MDSKDNKGKRPALGRGLSALISSPVPVSFRQKVLSHMQEQDATSSNTALNLEPQNDLEKTRPNPITPPGVSFLPITDLVPNPKQPRQHFAESDLAELAASIQTLGVLQPILVRPSKSLVGRYEIVAGERRWRASQRASLEQVPVVVKSIDDRTALEIALVENVQRANLNPVEEGRAYQRLVDEFALTQNEIAERVSKDRATVANMMRLLKLPKEVLDLIENGSLSSGHARCLLAIKDSTAQVSLAKMAVSDELSVRALESIVSRAVVLDAGKTVSKGGAGEGKAKLEAGASFPEVIDRLRNALGTKVTLKHQRSGKGKIEIEYFSEAELDRVVEKICR